MNGAKGRAKTLVKIKRKRLKEAKAAGIDVSDRRAVKAYQDAKFKEMVARLTNFR